MGLGRSEKYKIFKSNRTFMIMAQDIFRFIKTANIIQLITP
jgi:hypothetical protein